jgi:hypothetical protein
MLAEKKIIFRWIIYGSKSGRVTSYELADRAYLNLKPSAVRPRAPLDLPLNVINAVDRENLLDHPNKPRDGILTH